MTSNAGEEFAKGFLSHAYDPAKAHAYYERTKKLKGRKSGTTGTSPTNRHRANAIATEAAAKVGPRRTAAIQQLADKAKQDLGRLTEDFRNWVNSHPKATPQEKEKQRDEIINQKNAIIKKLKSDVAKISSAASSKSTPVGGTEGRHH